MSGAGLGGEKSGHVIVLEHTHVGRRPRDRRSRCSGSCRPGAAGASPSWPPRSRCCPQQQRAVRVRHKDQWEGDPVLRRAIADRPRPGWEPGGRILVRPSGTEPALRVMVEGPDAALVAELADSIAALAGERLH